MSRYHDGLKVATHIFEAAAWHYAIKVVCSQCANSATFGAHGLWWHFQRHGWDDQLDTARQRFWCQKCAALTGKRVRPQRLELVREMATDNWLPLPDEREWKRALSRFRS